MARPQFSDGRSIIRCFKCLQVSSNGSHIKELSPATGDMLQLRPYCSYCSQLYTTAVGKRYRDGCKGSSTSRPFLKPQEYITAAMTDKVTIVNGKLEGNDVWILDLPCRLLIKALYQKVYRERTNAPTTGG